MSIDPTDTARRLYEAEVARRPLYPDGAPRRRWEQLGAPERRSWSNGEEPIADRLVDFVRESNAIEGIFRDPTDAEIDATRHLVALPVVMVADVETFVATCERAAETIGALYDLFRALAPREAEFRAVVAAFLAAPGGAA